MKNGAENEELQGLRHSLAHLLAAAVLELYPDTKPTIGPAIENGFYYDFDFSSPIKDEDLGAIEDKMKKLLTSFKTFEGKEVSIEQAKEIFKDNPYKLELINEINDKGEKITLYTSGEFTDLCRGGHFDGLHNIDPRSFQLDKVAGAYWRGDENNKMLTRIYGLAFESKGDLNDFITNRQEAEKRDHRKIGKEMDLFTFSDLVGAGLPMFTPKGTALRNAIIKKIHEIQGKYGYQEVWIPHITKPDLYKTSGHWEKFGDELFKVKGRESEFVMKPMNCPHHTQIFASKMRTYKELPIRFTEATAVYRDEQSGELIGLGRVRSITQDDGHVFCTEDQMKDEIKNIVQVIKDFYSLLGLMNEGDYRVSLSAGDPSQPEKYLGDKEVWEKAENILEEIAKEENLPYKKDIGEAAFYGPKLDFMFKDALGRERQLGTAQLDFVMPKRFGLEYIDQQGMKQTPVMIHRAIAGSLERFLSIAIEHFAGNFPFWMAPVQIKIIPVGENHIEKAKEIMEELSNYRIEADLSDDGFGKKIRQAKVDKVPYFIIIGDKEMESGKFTLESRDDGQVGQLDIVEIKKRFLEEK